MTKLIWLSPCLALTACAAQVPVVPAATTAAAVNDAACGASNYRYLIGRPASDAREITDREYRLAVTSVAAARAGRVTLIYNPQTQRITEVRCG